MFMDFEIWKGKKIEFSVCKKLKLNDIEVSLPPLPTDRTKFATVFQVLGVDVLCKLLTKPREMVWIVVFLWRIFEVVYLKLITSQITSTMIQAQREFIARRMQISELHFDN